ncbi:uncharacterized protein [Argopecten irradians]|uniref:uncharacterized protein n=1 Tax=Argopecten irradians TaxID=31199 RepID=UPI00371209A6
MWLFEKETDQRSQMIIDSQAKDLEHQAGSSTDTDFSDAAKAKLRYIAGACIHKISSRLRQSVIRSLGKSKTCKFSSKFNYCKQNLLKQLQIQETDMAESTDQDSFAEIEFRQGASRGLRIVNDSVFNYFLKLNSVLQVYMSPESFHLHGEKIHIVCRQGLGDNEDLLDEWIQLFSNTLDDTEDEVFLSLLLDLYSVVNEHFVRIALLEGLHTFKTLIPRKKKQALRQKLQALGEKKTKEKGEKRKMPTPEVEEDDEYLCKECATVCEWEPSSVLLESLACDVCNSWYHYKCVGLKGNETFLKKSNSKWLCVHCKSSKGKGKGKGRGKGKKGK